MRFFLLISYLIFWTCLFFIHQKSVNALSVPLENREILGEIHQKRIGFGSDDNLSNSDGIEDYIVQLRPDLDPKNVDEHLDWLHAFLKTHGFKGKVKHTYNFGKAKFKGYSVSLPPNVVRVLEALPLVVSIEKDALVSVSGTVQQSNVINWGLSRIWQRTVSFENIYRFWSSAGFGVDVYIVDSGIYINHTDFGGRAKEGVSFADFPTGDQNGHGTHVAGTIGGLQYGVAKSCNLISVKVLNSNGVGPYSNIIAGLNWIFNTATTSGRPSVINMSVSGPSSTAVNSALEACIAAGIHAAVAAGNANTDACLSTPSSASGVVVAGSMNMYLSMSAFSNWGKCVSLLSPGEVIVSAGITSNTSTRAMSGTSMASPHVAGSMAMILSQVRMSPARLRRFLSAVVTPDLITSMKNDTINALLFLNSNQITVSDVLAVT